MEKKKLFNANLLYYDEKKYFKIIMVKKRHILCIKLCAMFYIKVILESCKYRIVLINN